MSDVEALAAACAGGHLDKVEALLAKGSRPGPAPPPRNSVFPRPPFDTLSTRRFSRGWRAAPIRRPTLTSSLSRSSRTGVDANAEDAIFGTPLIAAARGGHDAVVAALLRCETVDADRRSQRDTPLTAAASEGHLTSAKLLVESGRCDLGLPQQSSNCPSGHRLPSDDALTLAAKRGDVALVDLLLSRGANPNGGAPGTCDTPLTAAATCGHADVLERLLKAGADVDGVAQWAGRTALVAAAESDSAEARRCCEILLKTGADANFVSAGVVGRRLGYGAVHAAAARMDCDMVRLLVASGADPNRRARNTDTKDVKSRRAAAARALWGADVAERRLDNTPLHLAVAAYINEAAKRRVQENASGAGASAGGGGVTGGVPGEGERRAIEVVKTLLESGADHGAFVVDSTPLHMAALGGAVDVVDLLMKNGADVNARAPNGYTTPLEAAARYAADIILDFHSGDDDAEEPAERSDPNRGGRRGGAGDGAGGDAIEDGSASANASRTRPTPHPDSDDSETADDDFAAMAALRDAAGPLRALMHLVNEWHAEVTPHALVGACRAGDEDAVNCLLDEARRVGGGATPVELVRATARNTTALHAAAESGSVAVARTLLECGAEVEHRRPDDDATPLFLAARAGRPGMISFLSSRGADIEALCKTADRREGHDTVTPLVEAVMSDQAAAAARLIALGADVRAPNSWMPPLLTATLRSNATITRMLLREGADPRVGVGGMTPLGLAVMTRQSELVHALLDWREGDGAGGDGEAKAKDVADEDDAADEDDDDDSTETTTPADPNDDKLSDPHTKPKTKRSASARRRRLKMVDPDEPIDAAVLDDGDPELSTACQCAVCQRRRSEGQPANPACVPPSAGGLNPYGPERHLTPLAAAAKLDDAETVRALLAAGAGPEKMSGGMPPLAHAAGKGSCAAIVALLDGGAKIESAASLPLMPRDFRVLTPLGVASEAGELAAVRLLLDRGANPNGPPGAGFEPPLCCAVTDPPDDEEGNPVVGVVRALIAAGADPNASKEDLQSPYSPLMVAAGAGSVAVVRELLSGGADLEHVVRVTVGDSGGPRGGPDRKCHITALLHAAYCNELDAVRFLLLRGAKLGSADREAMTLVCDHLRSKAAHGVPDAGATLSLLRHQADAEADEEDEKAEQRMREERARAAELKEERKRLRAQEKIEAEAAAEKRKAEEEKQAAEAAAAEAERLAAKVRKQEEYKKEQEARKAAAAAKRAEAKAAKAAAKAAADAEAAAEAEAQKKVLDEVQAMVADLELKRKAEEAEREKREAAERAAAVREEEERERAEKAAEAAELERKSQKIANDAAAARGKPGAEKKAGEGGKLPGQSAKAHLLARDEAEGFTGPPTNVTKEDAAEASTWAQPAGFFVFLCNDSTEEECYERMLMGAPAKFWDNVVDHVKPGTTLILYNFAARTLTGPYEALSAPKWNEHADAWQGGRGAPPGRRLVSAFPAQVPIGPSPIMEAVTATLGGDFRPSMGGLPLGSPDQTRRDIIVTKLRLAAKEKGVACPSAAERRRAAAATKTKNAVAAGAGEAPGGDAAPPKGVWAAAAAKPTTTNATATVNAGTTPAVGESKSPGNGSPPPSTAGSAASAAPANAGATKPQTKKEKRAARRAASKESSIKTIPAPIGLSVSFSPTSESPGSTASVAPPPRTTSPAPTAAPAAAPAASASNAPASAVAPPGFVGKGSVGVSVGAGGNTFAPARPAVAAAAPIGALGGAVGGGWNAGAFGRGGIGVGFGGVGAGAAANPANAPAGGGGWNPLGGGGGFVGFGGGGIGGFGTGGGVVGGLFSGGGGLFAAPSENPYASRSANDQRRRAAHATPPGFGGGGAGGGLFDDAREASGDTGTGAEDSQAPTFSRAEQLFPWLS